MGVEWYYLVRGEEHGPVSQNELGALIRSGKLEGKDLVRATSGVDWQRADSVRFGSGAGGGDVWSDTIKAAMINQRTKDRRHRGRRSQKDETERRSLGELVAGIFGVLAAPFRWSVDLFGWLGRPIDWLAETFTDFGDRRSVQLAIRGGCVVVSVGIAVLIIREWSAHASLRDLGRQGVRLGLQSADQEPSVARYFPLVGSCGESEYWIMLLEVLAVVAVIAYVASGWLLSAEDE